MWDVISSNPNPNPNHNNGAMYCPKPYFYYSSRKPLSRHGSLDREPRQGTKTGNIDREQRRGTKTGNITGNQD